MGWKGVLREVGRAAKRAEKEQRRREKEERKRRERRAAASEVRRFESHLETIGSVHSTASEPVDWQGLRDRSPPEKPKPSSLHEDRARAALENFEPSWLDRLLGRTDRTREELSQEIAASRKRDQREFEQAQEDYEAKLTSWRNRRERAERVLSGDGDAYREVVADTEPLTSVELIQGLESFETVTPDVVSATIAVEDDQIVPSERKRQLKSGKLSVTDMPKTAFYGHYQDYVCSCVLRAARELHAILPIDIAIVTASKEMLNPATGHIEAQPIVSAAVPRETLDRLNLDRISPSEAMSNFVHEMEFRKTKGFKPTTRVEADEFIE